MNFLKKGSRNFGISINILEKLRKLEKKIFSNYYYAFPFWFELKMFPGFFKKIF